MVFAALKTDRPMTRTAEQCTTQQSSAQHSTAQHSTTAEQSKRRRGMMWESSKLMTPSATSVQLIILLQVQGRRSFQDRQADDTRSEAVRSSAKQSEAGRSRVTGAKAQLKMLASSTMTLSPQKWPFVKNLLRVEAAKSSNCRFNVH